MPLRSGYGNDVVRENIARMILEGMPHAQAFAAAYARARVSYFKRFPGGALPQWLAYPRKYRMREHYNASGASLKVGQQDESVAVYSNNPGPNPRKLEQAARLFEEFTGRRATRVTQHKLPALPREGLVFGRLMQVGYESARDGRPYRHTFRERSRPLLVATPDGKMVLIVGGRYAFTDRGIEDR